MATCGIVIETNGVAETQELGRRVAGLLQAGDILALSGDLGAGKTAFTQGIAAGLGVARAVTSPTFVLVNQYRLPAGNSLQHVDCYRLANAPFEMWDVGLSDLLSGDDIVVIEWADRVPELLPDAYLEIAFTYVDDTHRKLCFVAHGPRYQALLGVLAGQLKVEG
jgi:tRNA threonylcarbamoyladenosine biosynthesis protein TsaE